MIARFAAGGTPVQGCESEGQGQVRIFVTGGAGFIGSAVCRHLVNETNASVVNLDKLTYAANLRSLDPIESNPRYRFCKIDICDTEALAEAFRRFEPDAVMHLAAESHVDRSITGSADFIQTNIVGTHALLEAARHYWEGLSRAQREAFRFLHVSTDEVYGSLGVDGLFAETSPYSPNSPYAASKAAADHLANAWYHTYGLPVIVTNCSNNYGPYHFPEKLIPLVTLNALEGKPLPVYGKGDNVRDWLYVDDHARALNLILRRGRPGENYNIGGRNERTNLEVVEAICGMLDELAPDPGIGARRNLIAFVADRPGHDKRYAIDASKLEGELGWRARENFDTGLRKTVEWYLANEAWWRPLRAGVYAGERLGLPSRAAVAGKPGIAIVREKKNRPVLVIGRNGQVARALNARGFGAVSHVCLGREAADLNDPSALARAFETHEPALVVNAAAYTAVDKAESEPGIAFAINRDGPARLAKLCAARGIPLVHISTDYVFDGTKDSPYVEDDRIAPLNVYGASKAQGSAAVREHLREHVILRTSWVYSPYGSNFVSTMLRLGQSRDEVAVVGDQIGCPTSAQDIAEAIGEIAARLLRGDGEYGTFHLAGTGETSWHGFAEEIFAQAQARGRRVPALRRVSTRDYPTAARRPANSRLDCTRLERSYGVRLPAWKVSLTRCLDKLVPVLALVQMS